MSDTDDLSSTDHSSTRDSTSDGPASTGASPPPRRRRAARRPATSADAVDESEQLAAAISDEPPAEVEAARAAKKAPAKRTRKAAATAGTAASGPAAGSAAGSTTGSAVEPAPAPAKRTRKATKATAAADAESDAASAAEDREGAAPAPRKRSPRKSAPSASSGASGEEASTAEPGEEQAPARSSRTRARKAPVAPTFQAVDPSLVVATRSTAASRETTTDDDTDGSVDGGPSETGGDDGEGTGGTRRRRRGRRGRGRGRGDGERSGSDEESGDGAEQSSTSTDASAGAPPGGSADGDDDSGEGSGSSRRRRRRRRSGTGGDEIAPDDPPNTVTRVREPRSKKADSDGVRGVSGSTRLEAKRQRRRDGRSGSRRAPIVTEAEYLARRESVERTMIVRNQGERTQIAVLEDGILVEHYVTRASSTSYAGNVYLGKVQNVLPSMEAAFVDIGKGRNAVLYAGEVNYETAGLEGGRAHSIQEALKSGQNVLVQVTKDPIGQKGARLTSQVTLPGRYLVYVPEGSMTGISRKLPDTERTRLKAILKKIVPDDAGVIIRTAAEGASEDELTRDVERLQAQWEDIQAAAKKAEKHAPALLHAEPDLVVRVVRDVFNEDFASLVVQGSDEWETIEAYVSKVAPDLLERASRWTDETDVFSVHRVDEQLVRALDRKVHLPSGGSLVIDRTEAMTVVDVNTGKFTGKGGNLEETVTRNNLEAAEEIVRQLRLRDVGGIIVIDFIDMVLESNRDLVLRRLTECLGRDRTRHQVAEVTSLGLVQMTRKRVGTGLIEAYSEPCLACQGRGVIIHLDGPPVRAQHAHIPPVVARPKPPVPRPPARRTEEAPDAGVEGTSNGHSDDAPHDLIAEVAAAVPEPEQPSAPAPRRRRRASTGGPVSAAPEPEPQPQPEAVP
ncbi:MAG TPA: Rne/Rng family ribonuclease [Mycobacteriales bacterium]